MQRLRFVVEDGFDLRTRHAWEPFQKLVNRCAITQVFKQRSDWNTSVAKHPCPAEGIRSTLNRC